MGILSSIRDAVRDTGDFFTDTFKDIKNFVSDPLGAQAAADAQVRALEASTRQQLQAAADMAARQRRWEQQALLDPQTQVALGTTAATATRESLGSPGGAGIAGLEIPVPVGGI